MEQFPHRHHNQWVNFVMGHRCPLQHSSLQNFCTQFTGEKTTCTVCGFTESTVLERSLLNATNLNYRIESTIKQSAHYNDWATRIMPHCMYYNKCSHTICSPPYCSLFAWTCRKTDLDWPNLYKHDINYSTQCLSKTTRFPHMSQNLASTVTYQWQVCHLLLAVTNHSLHILPREMEGSWYGQGDRLVTKKIWQCVSKMMSSTLSWKCLKIHTGIFKYCLSQNI
jgi:hypothetical protein